MFLISRFHDFDRFIINDVYDLCSSKLFYMFRYVQEQLELDPTDPNYHTFAKIFETFKVCHLHFKILLIYRKAKSFWSKKLLDPDLDILIFLILEFKFVHFLQQEKGSLILQTLCLIGIKTLMSGIPNILM